jgi:IS30 family transposase
LPTAHGNYKYAAVAVEYFKKWIEVKLLVNIAATGLRRFFWQIIICHFGVPRKITFDNGKQFDCHILKDFCHQMGAEKAFASVYHPRSNMVVEKANTLIFTAIKMILVTDPWGGVHRPGSA